MINVISLLIVLFNTATVGMAIAKFVIKDEAKQSLCDVLIAITTLVCSILEVIL